MLRHKSSYEVRHIGYIYFHLFYNTFLWTAIYFLMNFNNLNLHSHQYKSSISNQPNLQCAVLILIILVFWQGQAIQVRGLQDTAQHVEVSPRKCEDNSGAVYPEGLVCSGEPGIAFYGTGVENSSVAFNFIFNKIPFVLSWSLYLRCTSIWQLNYFLQTTLFSFGYNNFFFYA